MPAPTLHPPITLQARAGQPVEITLDALPGAGLQWLAPALPPGCTLTEVATQEPGTGVGGGMRQRFLLTCTATGQHTLTFDHKRPWEAGARAQQSVVVTVR